MPPRAPTRWRRWGKGQALALLDHLGVVHPDPGRRALDGWVDRRDPRRRAPPRRVRAAALHGERQPPHRLGEGHHDARTRPGGVGRRSAPPLPYFALETLRYLPYHSLQDDDMVDGWLAVIGDLEPWPNPGRLGQYEAALGWSADPGTHDRLAHHHGALPRAGVRVRHRLTPGSGPGGLPRRSRGPSTPRSPERAISASSPTSARSPRSWSTTSPVTERRSSTEHDRRSMHGPALLQSSEIPVHGRRPETEARPVKTMTCRQLGGPCECPHHGNTADEVIKAQDQHLKDVVASGDEAHEPTLKADEGQVEASSFRNGMVQTSEAGFCRASRRVTERRGSSFGGIARPFRGDHR